jgi:hypothetical protein
VEVRTHRIRCVSRCFEFFVFGVCLFRRVEHDAEMKVGRISPLKFRQCDNNVGRASAIVNAFSFLLARCRLLKMLKHGMSGVGVARRL